MLEDLTQVPSFEADPSFYSDWGDPRVYTIGDMGVGECAGEVISVSQFEMVAAERLVFEGQLSLDDGDLRAGRCACLRRHAAGRTVSGEDGVHGCAH